MGLHHYQEKAVDEIRGHFSNGKKKVLLHLATGGGKTHIFSHILKQTAALQNRCMMVVRGRQLVDQASQRLFRESVHHGVVMAGHWLKRPGASVQICSIDTLYSRKQTPEAKLIVIDEAHMATSEGYHWLTENYPNAYILGVTATPYTYKPLSHIADEIVHPITTQELIEQGFLVPPRYFAPSQPDLKGIKIVQREYQNEQLEERMNELTGDIVEHWKTLGEGRPTLAFAVNIHHSKTIVAAFNAAGIKAEHIEGMNSDGERREAIARLKSGETKILSNVGVLCTGVDIPFAGCIIMARPTRSYSLFIQQAGRGTRTCPEIGKRDFLLLDHAGNVLRHGFITQERPVDLGGFKSDGISGPQPHQCKICFGIFTGSWCPTCDREKQVAMKTERDTTVYVRDGRLTEITSTKEEMEIMNFVAEIKEIKKKKGLKHGWLYYQVKDKYGEDVAEKLFPKRYVPPFVKLKREG